MTTSASRPNPPARLSSDRRRRPDPATRQVAQGLGWFSLALGVTELTCGDAIARWLGMPRAGALVRAYGLREIVQGAGILGSHDPTPWIWARVPVPACTLACRTWLTSRATCESMTRVGWAWCW